MLRIIAGKYGGRRIASPSGDDTRPTSDRVRESLFSIIQPALVNARVLDLFSGSGALGLEALSRGALCALLVDSSAKAHGVINGNIALLGASDAESVRMDAFKAIAYSAERRRMFDLVFLDPPYAGGLYQPVMAFLLESGVLAETALIIAESDTRCPLPHLPGYILEDARRYGETLVSFFRVEGGREHE